MTSYKQIKAKWLSDVKQKIISLKPLISGITKFIALGIIVAAVNYFVYRQISSCGLIHLDEQQLLQDAWGELRAKTAVADAFSHDVFKGSDGSFYRPGLTLSFIADARHSGNEFSTAQFFKTNLILQISNALLCLALLLRLGYPGILAVAAALCFSLHPALAGASAWIPGRNDSLLFLFAAFSFLFLIEAQRRKSLLLFLVHLAAYSFALFTKETALLLAPVFAFWIYFAAAAGEKRLKQIIFYGFAWSIVTGFYLLLRASVLPHNPGGLMSAVAELPFRTSSYLAYIVLPFHIPVYAWFEDLHKLRIWVPVAAGFFVFTLIQLKKKGWIIPWSLAAMCFLILPSAFSNRFIPHRLYLPVFFFSLAVTEIATYFYALQKVITVITLAAAVIFLGYTTSSFLGNFKNPENFWGASLAASPSCGEAAYELGYCAHLKGDTKKAEEYYLKIIKTGQPIADARNNLGVIYKQAGRYDEAMTMYLAELALEPEKGIVLENIGNLFMVKGDFNGAISYYKRKIIKSESEKTYKSLIFCLIRTGRLPEAEKYTKLLQKYISSKKQ